MGSRRGGKESAVIGRLAGGYGRGGGNNLFMSHMCIFIKHEGIQTHELVS